MSCSIPARDAFTVAYRACRAGDPHNRGRSYRNNYAFALNAAAAVRGARGGVRPVLKEDRYSFDMYLRIALQKMKEALHLRASGRSHSSVEYLMWEAWIYIAGIRKRRGEPRLALAAFREVLANGAGGRAFLAARVRGNSHLGISVDHALDLADSMIATGAG